MERLRSAEGVKMAVLQHDIAEVQKDITRIDEILMTMEDVAANGGAQSPDIVGFLHKYRQINENIEYASTKQFKVEIDVMPNDLPRELAEKRVLMEHYEEQRRLLKFKDDVIWKLSQELKKKYDYYQEEFDKETRHEMNEWARLVDRYASELKKYELVCSFCGQHLADGNVNAECPENHPKLLSGRSHPASEHSQ
jgi:palmitoyltransferase